MSARKPDAGSLRDDGCMDAQLDQPSKHERDPDNSPNNSPGNNLDDSPEREQERIARVYRGWHGGAALARYAWHRPDIVLQQAMRARVLSRMLADTVGTDLAKVQVVDVGCGTGGFLRQLIDWGATPSNLVGTELQQDRLDLAAPRTASGVRWHCGSLTALPGASADLIAANTVFSSVLDQEVRQQLAADMWRVLRPGGWSLVFDFRYNNPKNPHVRRVTRSELDGFWPGERQQYRTLLLAPPISRALAGLPALVTETLAAVAPPLRSHFLYMVQKKA